MHKLPPILIYFFFPKATWEFGGGEEKEGKTEKGDITLRDTQNC